MRVEQFYNKNQFVITGDGVKVFQSYDSTIAKIDADGRLSFGDMWDYSLTTRKHLYLFLSDYKNTLENFTYSQLFYKDGGLNNQKNKRAFLQNLIDKKVIKVNL